MTTTYAYDAADQLLSESSPGYAASYTYDANGNRTGKTLNGVAQTYAIDDGDKLTSIAQGGTTVKSYTYDAAGRTKTVVSSAGTTTLSYDYESRVTSIAYPGGATNSFSYNGLDARVGKVDSAGTAAYRRDGAGVTAPVLSDGAAVYTPGVSQRRSGTTTYDLLDRLGTAGRQSTNTSGTVSANRGYDAFGILVTTAGSPVGPFGFAGANGYQEDGDSGLKLLGHRYYDPSTGRFLTRDPAKSGRNWYAYCDGNPLRGVDPDGLRAFYFGAGFHVIGIVLSISLHIDFYYDPDDGGVGVGFSGGAGPGGGLYGGIGIEGGYDGAAGVSSGTSSNYASGIATPIGSAEALDNGSDMIPTTNTGGYHPTGGGISYGPGAFGGVYRERRVTALLRAF